MNQSKQEDKRNNENYVKELEKEIKIQQSLIIDYENKINIVIDENEQLSQMLA